MAPPNSSKRPNEAFALAGKSVLVVDDSPVNRKLIVNVLNKQRMRVESAENGREAIDRASESLPDVVIMSCQMPVMDAYQAARHLRQRYDHQALTLIAISTDLDFDAETRCRASGIDDLLPKPIDPSKLIARLRYRLLGETDGNAGQGPDAAGEELRAVDHDLENAGLDLKHGLGITAGDRAAYYELLKRFVTHHAGDGARLAAQQDLDSELELVRVAHSLKGVSGNIGAREIRALAERVEHGLRHGDDLDLKDLGHQLDECFCRIGAVLDKLPEDDGADALPAGHCEVASVAESLDELANLIRLQDIDASQLADEIYRQLTTTGRDAFRPVMESLKTFKFDLAQSALREIAQSAGLSIREVWK